jgi:hypothetical protein
MLLKSNAAQLRLSSITWDCFYEGSIYNEITFSLFLQKLMLQYQLRIIIFLKWVILILLLPSKCIFQFKTRWIIMNILIKGLKCWRCSASVKQELNTSSTHYSIRSSIFWDIIPWCVVKVNWTIWHYIPENEKLHSPRWEPQNQHIIQKFQYHKDKNL